MPDTILAFLTQSPRTNRWFFSARNFITHTATFKGKNSFEYLSPKSSDNLQKLPEGSITSAILPIEWNEWTKDQVLKYVDEQVMINHVTGEISPVQ